jgi:hypothetical protein
MKHDTLAPAFGILLGIGISLILWSILIYVLYLVTR